MPLFFCCQGGTTRVNGWREAKLLDMDLVCSHCGQTIVIEGSLVDGQNVMCPSCGMKNKYSKPSRIELPIAEPRHKPELHVRRPLRTSTFADQIASDAVRSVENRARIFEELKDREVRRKRWGFLMSLVGTILLVLGSLIGFDMWRTRQEKSNLARTQEQIAKAQAKADLMKAEREHQQELKAMRDKENAERELARKQKESEEEARRAKIKAARERYGSYVILLQNKDIAFASELEKMSPKPDVVAYLLPHVGEQARSFVVVEQQTNGTEQIYRLTCEGSRESVDRELFARRCREQDYFAVAADKVYFHSARKKQHVGRLSKQKAVDLSDAFFGALADDVKSLDPDFSNLSFEIVFVPNPQKAKEFLIAEVVEFGAWYSIDRVRNAIVEAYPPKSVKLGKGTVRKFKRRYRFWDGSHIKTGIDGVTYVPRVQPQGRYVSVRWSGYGRVCTTGRSSAEVIRWANLKEKVEDEEREEKAYYDNQETERRNALSALATSVRQKYEAEVNQMMNDGELFFRAKMK